MPKWKEDAKEFLVTVHHSKVSGCHTTSFQKPIIIHMGNSRAVEAITLAGRLRKTGVWKSETER